MDKYTVVIILTAVGFFALAALLLVPIWRFLNSEQKRAEEWTEELRDTRSTASDVRGEAGKRDDNGIPTSGTDDHERR